ncbi:MAG: helix-turn-helix domain-containing protein [Patescibacteria group bacterium]
MTDLAGIKNIKPDNFGDVLKEARLDRGISLDKASKDLNIAFKYLDALEKNRLRDIPGSNYLKSFLNAYCQYLALDFSDLWDRAKIILEKETRRFQPIEKKHFFVWSKFIKQFLIGLVIVVLAAFLIIRVDEIFRPPYLRVIQPLDGSITTSTQILIKGESQKEAEIVINNKLVFVDNRGGFETVVDLQNGLNLIKITAKKRYSRVSAVEVRVLLTERQKTKQNQ